MKTSDSRLRSLSHIILALSLAACGGGEGVIPDEGFSDAGTIDSGPQRTAAPVLHGLLFDIQGCADIDCASTGGVGGDVLYDSTYSHPLVFGFDFAIPDKPLNPTYEFYVAPDAAVLSPVDAEVTRVTLSQNDEDYSIWLVVPGAEDYLIIIDHVRQPTVMVGDSVVVGETLGLAGIWTVEQGRTELQINDEFEETAVCPVALLDPAIRADYEARLEAMYADFEAVKGSDEIYDETTFVMPGCLYERFDNP